MKLNYEDTYSDDVYTVLAQAVVKQAVKDYVFLNKALQRGEATDRYGADVSARYADEIMELRTWLLDGSCNVFNPLIDGNRLIRLLDKKVQKKR